MDERPPEQPPTAARRRYAGVLLHPTSLPGRFGVGDLGPAVEPFLDWARQAGQSLWQVLPLGPPEGNGSPYSCLSAFAGNPLLISPELLRDEGLLDPADLDGVPDFPPERVDFGRVAAWKDGLLRRSWELFARRATAAQRAELERFAAAPEQRLWLADWALFSALRQRHGGRAWWEWPAELARREPAALARAAQSEAAEVAYHRYLQLLFFRQWRRVREAAHRRGLRVLGDLPIYVAHDSAEVWSAPELFDLDEAGRPHAVAGVPPDYFSATGQLWGNPLYRWERMAERGFVWWRERLAANLRLADAVRIDHFRGFAGYWRIPAGAATAASGEWVAGPGKALFTALRNALGALPIVAEDLGVVTPDVEALRRDLALPGMKVLHFAFLEPDSDHLPHRFAPDCVVYTGTHDNETTAGWFRNLDPATRRRVRRYAGGGRIHRAMIRLAYTSVADTAVVPVQDVLGLGNEARMNTPAVAAGNWGWRLGADALTAAEAAWLRALAEVTGRLPTAGEAE